MWRYGTAVTKSGRAFHAQNHSMHGIIPGNLCRIMHMLHVTHIPVLLIMWQLPAMRKDRQLLPQRTDCHKLQELLTAVLITCSASVRRLLSDSTAMLYDRQPIAVQRCLSRALNDDGSAAALTDEVRHVCIWVMMQWTHPLWWCHSRHLTSINHRHYHHHHHHHHHSFRDTISLPMAVGLFLLQARLPGTLSVTNSVNHR